MTATAIAAKPGRGVLYWIGWVLSGLFIAFMIFDVVIKLMSLPIVRQTQAQMGLPVALDPILGPLELACLALYVFPRTAVLGAVLTTGYLGGAILAHLRIGSPLFSHVLFGVYLGLMAWGGLYLRDPKLRKLFPWRR